MTLTRRLLGPLLAIALLFGAASPAVAQDNTAIAVNTKDGSSVFKLAFSIKKTLQPVVEHGNAAVAYASCTDCQTVAIAIQIVLVMGDATTVSPENVAIAINDNCTACETLASAYQFVLGTGGVVRLSNEGRKQLNEIRRALRELSKGDLSIEEIQARVGELTQRLHDVFTTELVAVGPDEIAGSRRDGPDAGAPDGPATPEASTTPDATETSTPSPQATATPVPTATPTASAEPTATPVATATPTAAATP